MADVDHRKPQKILRIRLRRYDIIIIRYKFRMHTGFLTKCHNMLQFVVLTQSQCDSNLIQPVLRQDHGQVLNPSDHFDSFVHRRSGNLVIQYSADAVSPLRICNDPVYILLCCTAVSHQKDLLLIHAMPADVHQYHTDQIAYQCFRKNIECIKNTQHFSRKVNFVLHVRYGKKYQQCYGIRLYHIAKLQPASLYPFGRVQIKCLIKQQQPRYQEHQS